MDKPFRIGLFMFDGVDEMDVVGPLEVLAWWRKLAAEDGGQAVEVFTFALPIPDGLFTFEPPIPDERNYVVGAKNLKLVPDRIWPHGVLPLDVLFYLGGPRMKDHFVDRDYKTRRLRPDIVAMLDEIFASGTMPVSVCVGALPCAAYGIFDDKAATTHWAALEQLGELGKNVTVLGDERFVDCGDCISSAGISAGIDMAFHFVQRFGSTDMARRIKRTIQYYPAPPVSAIVSPPW